MKKATKIVQKIVAGANVATILVMLAVGFSDRISPEQYPIVATVGLTFPVFVVLNLCFLVFWAIVKPIKTIIPVVGFLLCYHPIRNFSPLNIKEKAPEDAIKLISYNVLNFAEWESEDEPSAILDYLKEQDADIVCLQECSLNPSRYKKMKAVMSPIYPYLAHATTLSGGDEIAVFSKFPILDKDTIEYKSDTNHSLAFRLKIHNDTVLLINNHFESNLLTKQDKQNFTTMIAGRMSKDTIRTESKMLVDKIGKASARRAPQAEAVAKYIEEQPKESILLCGDFNDSPISYTHRTLAKLLNDCYVATGNGQGISYHYNLMYVRIDHIMCSDDWTPYECHVDNTIKASDHYPIVCYLKKNATAKTVAQ